MAWRPRAESVFLLVCLLLFSAGLFRHLSHPLLWQDEAETVMFATRILEYGYPKVHGERNVVNEFGDNPDIGVKQGIDAYVGVTWAQFYAAVPGVLLASLTDDLYAKTLLLRIPFALAGALGLGILVLALRPVFSNDRRRARLFGALFFLLATVSLSLVLHLREVRYYTLLMLLVPSAIGVYLRFTVFTSLGLRAYAISFTLLLILLFNTFYPAYFIFVALVAIDRGLVAWRADGALGQRILRELPGIAPVLASAVVVGPLLVFYETFSVASTFSESLGLTLDHYALNLWRLFGHYLRHEFLAPAIACRIALNTVRNRLPRQAGEMNDPLLRKVSDLLTTFVVIYAAVGCANPLFYERYFVVLSPFVTSIFLLDAFGLMDAVPKLVAEPRRRVASASALCALLAITTGTVGLRSADLRGRLDELTQPYRGVLDFVIPYLRDQYPHPEDLVIATNYSAHSYMYYLGSHVIVGLSLNNIANDRLLDPDVVIPRRRWPKSLDEVMRLMRDRRWRRVSFPVTDTEFNNIPALSRTPWLPDRHRFRTPTSTDPNEQLGIFLRDR